MKSPDSAPRRAGQLAAVALATSLALTACGGEQNQNATPQPTFAGESGRFGPDGLFGNNFRRGNVCSLGKMDGAFRGLAAEQCGGEEWVCGTTGDEYLDEIVDKVNADRGLALTRQEWIDANSAYGDQITDPNTGIAVNLNIRVGGWLCAPSRIR